ncbi:hypothetical protein UXP46_22870 [Enterobacter ludwigii]|uniref:hypothetical protein n=1 Tax=Enterobacter ludwigii TaxID=299767 RepID=UPI002FD4A42E
MYRLPGIFAAVMCADGENLQGWNHGHASARRPFRPGRQSNSASQLLRTCQAPPNPSGFRAALRPDG